MARLLKERPCKTLEFETKWSGLRSVLHRPVEIAIQSSRSAFEYEVPATARRGKNGWMLDSIPLQPAGEEAAKLKAAG